MKRILHFLNGDRGATAVEYAIIASAIAAVICAVVMLLGTSVSQLFQSANTGW